MRGKQATMNGRELTWMLVGVAVGYFVLAKYLGK